MFRSKKNEIAALTRDLEKALIVLGLEKGWDTATLVFIVERDFVRPNWETELRLKPNRPSDSSKYRWCINVYKTMRPLGCRPGMGHRALYAITEALFQAGALGRPVLRRQIRVSVNMEKLSAHEKVAAMAPTRNWATKAPSTDHIKALADELIAELTSPATTAEFPMAQGGTFCVAPMKDSCFSLKQRFLPSFRYTIDCGHMKSSGFGAVLDHDVDHYGFGSGTIRHVIHRAWRRGLYYCEFDWPDLGIAWDLRQA